MAPLDSQSIKLKIPGGVVACQRHRLIYYNMPKSACTTIKNIMYILDTGAELPSPLAVHKAINTGNILINRRQYEALREKIRNRLIGFTFVRHPLKRAYSCFNEKVFYQGEYSFPHLRTYLAQHYKAIFPESPGDYSVELHRRNFIGFLHFVRDNIRGDNQFRRDAHWLPQTTILHNYGRDLTIDFVGRVERFGQDMSYILDLLGVPEAGSLTKTKYNEGPKPPYSYDEVVDDEVDEHGESVYAKDYLQLAYSRSQN